MRSIRRLNLAALTMAMVTLAGCEVEGPVFKPMALPSTKAIIYVYRPYHYIGSIEEPEITCGSDTIAIGAGGYHAFVEEPGTMKCYAATAPGNPISFAARPETDYFVRELVSVTLTASQVTLTKVDRTIGLDEIESTRTPQ
ncbi:MAG TPA: hypothetical protein VNF29_13350 [Candidatus Binataceae bacterium]|nr:hypothetical protein [Candidatus Binataceae bacterium]